MKSAFTHWANLEAARDELELSSFTCEDVITSKLRCVILIRPSKAKTPVYIRSMLCTKPMWLMLLFLERMLHECFITAMQRIHLPERFYQFTVGSCGFLLVQSIKLQLISLIIIYIFARYLVIIIKGSFKELL